MKQQKEKIDNELNPYELDKLSKVPSWLIISFMKFWAAAAAIFFVGISNDIFDFSASETQDPYAIQAQSLALIIVFAVFLAVFIGVMVRPFVRLMYNRRNNTYKYNMVNCKGIKSFFLNLIYMFPMSFILYFLTIFLSDLGLVLDPFGTTGGTGIEPLTYGFCFLIVDTIFCFIKNGIIELRQRYIYNKQIKGE